MLLQLLLLSVTLIAIVKPFTNIDLQLPFVADKQAEVTQSNSQPNPQSDILGATLEITSDEIETPPATPSPSLTPSPTSIPEPTQTPTIQPTKPPTPRPTITPPPTVKPTAPAVLPKYIEPTNTPTPKPTAISKSLTGPQMDALFSKYATQYNIDREQLRRIAICESNLNPQAKNINYVGMYQFGQPAWISNRTAMGLNTDLTLRTDPEESIKTAAWMISQGKASAWPNCK